MVISSRLDAHPPLQPRRKSLQRVKCIHQNRLVDARPLPLQLFYVQVLRHLSIVYRGAHPHLSPASLPPLNVDVHTRRCAHRIRAEPRRTGGRARPARLGQEPLADHRDAGCEPPLPRVGYRRTIP